VIRVTFESNDGKVFSDIWKQFMCVKVMAIQPSL